VIDPTKDPWEVRPSLVRDVLGQPCGFDVYDSAGDRIGYQLDGPTASLVAAAPEMREALEVMLDAWLHDEEGRDEYNKARAVLAKLEVQP